MMMSCFELEWVLRSTGAKEGVRLFPLHMGLGISDVEETADDKNDEVEKENHDGDGYNYYVLLEV